MHSLLATPTYRPYSAMARTTQAAALLLFVAALCLVANSNAQERSLQQTTPGPFTYTIPVGSTLNAFLVSIGAPVQNGPFGEKSLAGIISAITGIFNFFTGPGFLPIPPIPPPVTTNPNTWTRLVTSSSGLAAAFCNGVTARTIVTTGSCSGIAANTIIASLPVNTVLNTATNQVTVNLCGPDQAVVANRPCTGWLCVANAAAANGLFARALCN